MSLSKNEDKKIKPVIRAQGRWAPETTFDFEIKCPHCGLWHYQSDFKKLKDMVEAIGFKRTLTCPHSKKKFKAIVPEGQPE